MNHSELKSIVLDSIGVVLNRKFETLPDETRLIADLNIESIEFVDIIFEIEKRIKTELDMNLLALQLTKKSKLHLSQVRLIDLVEFIELTTASSGQI